MKNVRDADTRYFVLGTYDLDTDKQTCLDTFCILLSTGNKAKLTTCYAFEESYIDWILLSNLNKAVEDLSV